MDLIEEFCAGWQNKGSLDQPLSQLVVAMAARAAGCWRLDDGYLKLIGFGWADDMPVEVSQGFQDATRCVSLDQSGLGIVKAAVTGQPAIGRRDPATTGLDRSASWIVKFEANTSLAVPIHNSKQQVIGVTAVSTAQFVEENDSLWQALTQLTDRLGNIPEEEIDRK